jgi:hypothetical protein
MYNTNMIISPRQQLCLIALAIVMVHFSGFPAEWKGWAFIAVAVYIVSYTYRFTIAPRHK